jgi:hypothetical protein
MPAPSRKQFGVILADQGARRPGVRIRVKTKKAALVVRESKPSCHSIYATKTPPTKPDHLPIESA